MCYSNAAGDLLVLSNWYTVAKIFGQLLNFNCALLLLPIARSFLLFLSNRIVASRHVCAANVPMQHNVKFHKIVARVTVVCAAVHMIAHMMAVAEYSAIYEALGLSPWITGTLIVASMFSIYSGGSDVRLVCLAGWRAGWLAGWLAVVLADWLVGWVCGLLWLPFQVSALPVCLANRTPRSM